MDATAGAVEVGPAGSVPSSSLKSSSQHGAKQCPKVLSLLAMSVVSLFASLSEGMIAPFLPGHLGEIGLDQSLWSGIIMAVQPIVVVISTPLVTCLLARFDHIGLLVGSLILQMVALFVFGFFGDYLAVMLAMRALQGLGMAVCQTANYMLVAGVVTELGFVNGLVELTSGAGFAFGPVLGSVLYEFGSFRLPFIVCGVSLAVASVLAPLLFALARRLLASSKHVDDEEEVVASKEEQDGNSFRRMWQLCTLSFLLPGGVTLLSNAVWGTFQGGFYPVHAVQVLKTTESAVGINLGAASTTMTLVSLLVGYVSDRLGHERVMVCGLLMAALSLLLLGPAGLVFEDMGVRRWWEFAIMLVLGLGQAVTSIPGLAAMMKAVPENPRAQEACSSLFIALIQLGLIVGMLLSAALGSHFVLGTILMASLMCFYAVLWMALRWQSSFSYRASDLQQSKEVIEESCQTYEV
eukprot:TRINITY_DN66640_c0_g1_i1.p1 TRINITY_DN66640_c0_g1~~TRINITY_DN66640_c0_g1_i1.p1  ORF type:complete len:465 (-),score=70.19 TRINITY_DN66640_c0_g1_i1:166-1560(-)